MSGTAHCSQDWGHRMKHMHGFPSVNILLTTKLLSHGPLSWDMDCLLTLWPLLIPCSLDNGCCTFGFLIFIIVERNSLYNNSLYLLTKRSLKHPCSTRDLGPHVFLSLSLSLSLQLIPWSMVTCRAHSPAWAFKTSSRGRPVPLWAIHALSLGFIRSLHNPGNISFFLFHFLIVDSAPPSSGPLKDPNNKVLTGKYRKNTLI